MTKQIPYDLIPAADLPKVTPGAFDSVVGVDESTGAARRFPMPITGAPKAYETHADLPATAPEGTAAYVNNDPTAENNGLWAFLDGAWVQSADRVTGLEGRVAGVERFEGEVDRSLVRLVSKNLYNPAAAQQDRYVVASTGAIATASGWRATEFIPIVPGQQYTISANGVKREGVAFYTEPVGASTYVPGSYNGGAVDATTSLTVTAPAEARYMVVNVKSTGPEPSEIQIEEGSVATPFQAYFDPRYVVPSEAVIGEDAPSILSGRLDALDSMTRPRKNLYNPASRTDGRYMTTSGALMANAAWAHSGFIPVEAGTQYTISANASKRAGAAFYGDDTPNGAGYISGSYNGNAVNASTPLTLTAPLGARFLVFNVESNTIPEPSEIQVEEGAVATPFEPWTPFPRTIQDAAAPGLDSRLSALEALLTQPGPMLLLGGEGSAASAVVAGEVRREFNPWPVTDLVTPPVFNPTADIIGGVVVKSSSDDAAPYHALDTTIGANHGYRRGDATVASHGKTQADVGSVWASVGVEYVLIGIKDANTLVLTRRDLNSPVPAGDFTHVSGATNTAGFSVTAVSSGWWFGGIANRECICIVDGVEAADRLGSYAYSRTVQFHESYDVLDRADTVEWFVNNPGTSSVRAEGVPAFSVSLVHQFDHEGNYTIYSDFVARKDGVALTDIMVTQAQRMNVSGDGAVNYYVPKALPFTHEGSLRDWAMIDTSDTSGWATRAQFTPARCDPSGILADRLVMLSDSYGFALGYAPVQDASPATRRANATVKALEISTSSGKIYPSLIDKGPLTLNKGDVFKGVAYRNVFRRPTGRTDSYVVRMQDRAFIYADWHEVEQVDRVPIPADLVGRPFTVIEARNATLMSESLTTGLLVDVAASGDYGYLIVEVA